MLKANIAIFLCFCSLLISGSVLADKCQLEDSQSGAYQINENGTVTDTTTGLTWMRCALGMMWNGKQCAGGKQWYAWFEWDAAIHQVRGFSYGGYQDWRLPSIDELETLLNASCIDSTINEALFPDKLRKRFWSQTEDADNRDYVWVVNFKNGRSDSQLKTSTSYYARLVRGENRQADSFSEVVLDQKDELLDDGIHDPDNPDNHLLQRPADAFQDFIKSNRQTVDWVKSLEQEKVLPRSCVEGETANAVFEFDIVMAKTRSMPFVVFKHSVHTQWLTCSNCHPEIFTPQLNSNPITMDAILLGEYCGRCHGRVAFSLFECERCHSVLHKDSPTAWWLESKGLTTFD